MWRRMRDDLTFVNEEIFGIFKFPTGRTKIWVRIYVTPAGIRTEFLLIGSRSGNHHGATLTGFVVFTVAACMQDNIMACLLCGSVRKSNWVTADSTSEVIRSNLPLDQRWRLLLWRANRQISTV
jgi:hypothetical protein